jgi:hypothetical protein
LEVLSVIMSSSLPSRFWLLVILSGLGSISCFGYAGMQTVDANPSATRQNADETAGTTTTTSLRLRDPISFVRDFGR